MQKSICNVDKALLYHYFFMTISVSVLELSGNYKEIRF